MKEKLIKKLKVLEEKVLKLKFFESDLILIEEIKKLKKEIGGLK